MLNEWLKVKMFRCVQDPMIGPSAKQAFMLPDLPDWEAHFNTHAGYLYVKARHRDGGFTYHVVPTGNLSSITLFEEGTNGKVQDAPREIRKKNETQTRSKTL